LASVIANDAPDNLLILDESGHIHGIGAGAALLWGCRPEALAGSHFSRLLPELMGDRLRPAAATVRTVARHGDGHTFPVAIALGVMHTAAGRFTLVRVTPADAPPQPRSGDRRQTPLAQAHAQRDTLVREVHHRIKNNLQSVTGLLQRQLRANPAAAPALKAAIAQVETIALVHGLQSRSDKRNLQLCDMLAGLVTEVNQLHPETDQCILINQLRSPAIVTEEEAVPVALIFSELITNAVKHRSGPADSTIDITIQPGDVDKASVTISNPSGPLPHGFDLFDGNGIGMGLRLVRSLMPEAGMGITFNQRDGVVSVEVELLPPVIRRRPGADGKHHG
jgi:two-component sensor histidine kinase